MIVKAELAKTLASSARVPRTLAVSPASMEMVPMRMEQFPLTSVAHVVGVVEAPPALVIFMVMPAVGVPLFKAVNNNAYEVPGATCTDGWSTTMVRTMAAAAFTSKRKITSSPELGNKGVGSYSAITTLLSSAATCAVKIAPESALPSLSVTTIVGVLLTPVLLLNFIFAPAMGKLLASVKRTIALNGVPTIARIGLLLIGVNTGAAADALKLKTTD